MLVDPGTRGDGGTLSAQSATVPQPPPPAPDPNAPAPGGAGEPAPAAGPAAPNPATPGTPGQGAPGQAAAGTARTGRRRTAAVTRVSAWDKDAPWTVPPMVVSVEQYNRMVRMIQPGEKLKMNVDHEEVHDKDLMAYNTIAEIPGTDLKDEIVMLGAHMDSWHSGTGARITGRAWRSTKRCASWKTQPHPRRTIRIALWSGEEEGYEGRRRMSSNISGPRPVREWGGALPLPVRSATGASDSSARWKRNRNTINSPVTSTWTTEGQNSRHLPAKQRRGKAYLRRVARAVQGHGRDHRNHPNTGSTAHHSFDSVGLRIYGPSGHHPVGYPYPPFQPGRVRRIQADDMGRVL